MQNNKTAVDWYYERTVVEGKTNYAELLEQAKEMGRQQIIDAKMDMFNHINQIPFGLDYLNKRDAAEEYGEQYYNEKYKTENNGK